MKKQSDNPRHFLEIINMALEDEGWPENDKLMHFSDRDQRRNKRLADNTWGGSDAASEDFQKKSRISRN
jgi:hypothetical protein